MSGVENISSLKTLCEKGFEIKTAYANKGMHFIMYDDPEWYLSQVNDFLK